jgi:hypothetical protein
MIKRLAVLLLTLTCAVAPARAQTPPPAPTPAATPAPPLEQYTGQLLDFRNDYAYFTTGDSFAVVDAPRVVDFATGVPTTVNPGPRMYARVTFDPATKKIIEFAISKTRIPVAREIRFAGGYAVAASTPAPAPELQGGAALTGRQVTVEFDVTVPPTTNFTDSVYIATDYSDWSPTAIKLDRVDAYRYRAQRTFASGTKFAYRVTRGTWNSVERGEDGLDAAPHQFFVREVDVLAARVIVYHWSDESSQTAGAGPNALPTPYNPNPFGGGPGGIRVPQVPTPAPIHH